MQADCETLHQALVLALLVAREPGQDGVYQLVEGHLLLPLPVLAVSILQSRRFSFYTGKQPVNRRQEASHGHLNGHNEAAG